MPSKLDHANLERHWVEALASIGSEFHGVSVSRMDRDELGDLLGRLRQIQSQVAGLIARIGARADQLADEGRCAPADEFLLGRGEVAAVTARTEARRATLAGSFPAAADRLHNGAISAGALDSLARRTRRLSDEQMAGLPIERIVEDAARVPVDTFDAGLRRRIDGLLAADPSDTDEMRRQSEFRHWIDRTSGMGRFAGRLDPERYEALTTAIDRHTRTLASAVADEPVTLSPNLAADALVQLVTRGDDDRAGNGPSAAVSVVVDQRTLNEGRHVDTVARTGDGEPLSDQSLARLCCDAVLRRVVHDRRGVPVDVGRRFRTATRAQWDAVRTVHSTCAWPGCTLPLRWTQLHHIIEWHVGGKTDLSNLVPLCHRHHHRVHEGRWTIRLLPDRTVQTFLPDGTAAGGPSPIRPQRPPPDDPDDPG